MVRVLKFKTLQGSCQINRLDRIVIKCLQRRRISLMAAVPGKLTSNSVTIQMLFYAVLPARSSKTVARLVVIASSDCSCCSVSVSSFQEWPPINSQVLQHTAFACKRDLNHNVKALSTRPHLLIQTRNSIWNCSCDLSESHSEAQKF
jgi:hypothetical protein